MAKTTKRDNLVDKLLAIDGVKSVKLRAGSKTYVVENKKRPTNTKNK